MRDLIAKIVDAIKGINGEKDLEDLIDALDDLNTTLTALNTNMTAIKTACETIAENTTPTNG